MNTMPTITREYLLAAPPTRADEWDDFVKSHEHGTFCHLHGWQEVLTETFPLQPRYLAAWDADGNVRGVMPLFRWRSLMHGRRYVSVPALNYGGPIGDPSAVATLLDHARHIASSEEAMLELRTAHPVPRTPVQSRKVTVVRQLPPTADALWGELPSKLRSQIRRPQKAGLTVRFGNALLPDFYSVWSTNMRDLGTPVLPRRFFNAVEQAFPELLMVGCVFAGDEPVAAGAGFLFRDRFEMTWASSLRSHSRDAPNMLLYWSFMEEAIRRGARSFDFGRCTPGEGTHRFKMQWGGESIPLPWVVLSRDAGTGRPGSGAEWASRAWRRLPLPVANAIGPSVARRLPWW